MEILPGVHAVQLLGARGHVLVDGDLLTLIDTGLPGSGPRLVRHLERLGRSVAQVSTIACTHGHPDHAGAARELLAIAPGAELRMHAADLARLDITLRDLVRRPSRGTLFAAVTPAPGAGRPLDDGEVLPVLGGLEVVHTPGHTPGSVCLYLRRQRALFVGDALEHRRPGSVTFASRLYSDDHPAARASVKRMAELDVQTLIFAHWRPVTDRANEILRGLAARAG